MAFLNDTGLQELRARLEAVYARKANITAGTAGETTDTSGTEITIPYVTMNAQGVVTGYGTKTHTVPTPEPAVSAPTITMTNEQEGGYYWRQCRLKIVITRTAASGTTYYNYNGSDSVAGAESAGGSFTGASATVYTRYTTDRNSSSKITANVIAVTKVDNDQSFITIASGISNAGSCNCSCQCSCSCDCDCGRT